VTRRRRRGPHVLPGSLRREGAFSRQRCSRPRFEIEQLRDLTADPAQDRRHDERKEDRERKQTGYSDQDQHSHLVTIVGIRERDLNSSTDSLSLITPQLTLFPHCGDRKQALIDDSTFQGVQGRRFAPRNQVPTRLGATEGTLDSISPELVLVDPELARVERARLADRIQAPTQLGKNGRVVELPAVQVPEVASQTRAGERPPSQWSRERLTPVLLSLSLMTNAILIAVVVAGSRNSQPDATLPPPLATIPQGADSTDSSRQANSNKASKHARQSTATTPHSTPTPRARPRTVPPESSGAVERKILALLVRSPTGKLPPALIDQSTGLAKNNLEAVCRATSDGSFLCIVRPARHRPSEGLYVRYRSSRNGRGLFTWYRYRHG